MTDQDEIRAELEYLQECLRLGLDTALSEKVMERIAELQRLRAEQKKTD